MNEINDLEIIIMSCLLIKPELMKDIILEDKHFKEHQRLWQFMKSFYKKFETFDVQLMYFVCKDKWHILASIEMLTQVDADVWNFEKYQKALIEDFEKSEKEKYLIQKIYVLANDLYVGKINVEQFKQRINEFYNNSEILFKSNQ